MSKKLHFDANLPGLLDEVLNNSTCNILKLPINITKGILAELAQLAIEIDDDRLHVMMLRLGLYEVSASERVELIKKMKRRKSRTSPCQLRQQRDAYRKALKDLLKIVNDITGQECCDYGHGEELHRIEMIADNKKPCRFCCEIECDGDRSLYMCQKHQVYCKEGYFPECKAETTLFAKR